jgi:cytochrome bd-type quinol oxidase subunit 1
MQQTQNNFESMLITSTFSNNYTSILIWLSLALASTLYLVLIIVAFIMYLKHIRTLNPRHPSPQHPQIPMEPLVNPLSVQQNHAILQE